jgi:hypothetical protein
MPALVAGIRVLDGALKQKDLHLIKNTSINLEMIGAGQRTFRYNRIGSSLPSYIARQPA